MHLWSLVPVLIYFKKVNFLGIIKNPDGEKIFCYEKIPICCTEITENGCLNSPKKSTYGPRPKFSFFYRKKKKQVREIL